MKNLFQRLIRNERGLTLPEYGIGLALAIVLGVGAMSTLAGEVGGAMAGAGNQMPCTAATFGTTPTAGGTGC